MYSASKSERQRFSRSLCAGMLFEHRPYFLACAPLPHHSLFAQGLSPRHKDHSLQQCKHTPNSVQTSLFKQRQKINKETTTKKKPTQLHRHFVVMLQSSYRMRIRCAGPKPRGGVKLGRCRPASRPVAVTQSRASGEERRTAAPWTEPHRALPSPGALLLPMIPVVLPWPLRAGKQPPWGTNDSLRGPSAGSRHAQPRGGDGPQEAAESGGSAIPPSLRS